MKKNALKTALAVILTIVLGTSVAFAAQVPSDVKGQSCEPAVSALMDAGVITGDVDGLFHPDSTLTRAQVCIMIARAIDKNIASDADASALGNKFSDMNGYDWAAGAIGMMAEKKYAAGYPNGTFKPGADVSVAELLTFVVRACGDKYSDSNIGGTWPENYITAACNLGIIDASAVANDPKGSKAATKAQAAEVIYKALDIIKKANGTPGTPEKDPVVKPEPATLDDFSGKIYGVINKVEIVETKDGTFPEFTVIAAGKEYLLSGKVNAFSESQMDMMETNISSLSADGALFELVSTKGKIKEVNIKEYPLFNDSSFKAKYSEELTYKKWSSILDINKTRKHIKITQKDSVNLFKIETIEEDKYISFKEDALVYFYDAEDEVYELSSVSSLSKYCSIRAYDLTDDDNDAADIILAIKTDEIKKKPTIRPYQ